MSMVKDECTHCGLLHGHMATCPAYQNGGDAPSQPLDQNFTPAPQSPDQACGAENKWLDEVETAVREVGKLTGAKAHFDIKRLIRMARQGLASRPAPADAVRVLVEALEPFVRELVRIDDPDTVGDSCQIWQCGSSEITRSRITYGNMRRARAALSDPRVIAAQSADPWLPIASDGPEVMTEASHPGAPGLGWKLSAEAQAALDAIDASQRAAAVQFPHLIIGSAAPTRQQEEPS